MEIRPIRTDDDHAGAIAEIERLWGAPQDTPEGDRLDVLATLVEAYEEKRWPIDPADPVDVIEFAITEMGRSQAELGRLFGSRSRASEVLKRKRPLTMAMVYSLYKEWRIPAGALIAPYHLKLAKSHLKLAKGRDRKTIRRRGEKLSRKKHDASDTG